MGLHFLDKSIYNLFDLAKDTPVSRGKGEWKLSQTKYNTNTARQLDVVYETPRQGAERVWGPFESRSGR